MDNKKLENKASKGAEQVKVNVSKQDKIENKRQKDAAEVQKKEAKLKEERAEKVRTEAIKNETLYITTDKYLCLPEGVEKVISNKLIADKFIKKGYIKNVKK